MVLFYPLNTLIYLVAISIASAVVESSAIPHHADIDKRIVGMESGFVLHLADARPGFKKSPQQVMAQTRSKYGKHIAGNDNQKFKVKPLASTVQADPTRYDQEYLAPVRVGGQLMKLDIDTGSSDLWVYSTYLPSYQQNNHSVYNPNMSSTAKHVLESSWSVVYGDGSAASGNVWDDCVWIGETVVENQGVELAEQLSSSFLQDPSDGIVGLGFDSLNSAIPMQKTFLSNAVEQGLPRPIVTANLNAGSPGSYDFGFIDPTKYSGEIEYAAVDDSQGYWIVNMTGWSFGYGLNNQSHSRPSYVQQTVVDTGTSINFLNFNVVQGYWATVPQSDYDSFTGGYVFPCGTALPDFTVNIGEFNVTIPGRMIVYSPTTNDPTCECLYHIAACG